MNLNVAAISIPVDALIHDPEDVVLGTIAQIQKEGPSDAFLFPEYMWAALAHEIRDEESGFKETSKILWQEVIPNLLRKLPDKGLFILGSGPYFDERSQRLSNRAPIIINGQLVVQEKLFLTPWEQQFHAGQSIAVHSYDGIRFAVPICLDVEIPELAGALHPYNLDVLFVPSATETMSGWERINRCASARSVELGVGVVVSHLRGGLPETVDLVSENIGGTACYLPSQSIFQPERERHQICRRG